MLKIFLIALLPLLTLFSNAPENSSTQPIQDKNVQSADTGILEKMIVSNGNASMNIDMGRLTGRSGKIARSTELRFDVEKNAFFTIMVFNDELRGPLPSSMGITPQSDATFPGSLNGAYRNLVVESLPWGGDYSLAIRDGKTGFTYFNVEGQSLNYDPAGKALGIEGGRLLLSKEYATEIGRAAGTVIGDINISTTMRPVEITEVNAGEAVAQELPAAAPEAGTVPGPDVIVGDLAGLQQFGASGTQVGLAVGTDSCNAGTVNLRWIANPSNDHPVIPQNLYRMSGGASNDERFEQIGQSFVKHAFTALAQNLCGFGCNGTSGTQLGSGCSDPYTADLNGVAGLGSRAWINPFTGFYPRNDGGTTNNSHSGHSHTGPIHRILVDIPDLTPATNPGASYFAEAQYVTPHEYVHCQSNPTQCNMYNNVSYRKYNVNGSGSPFSFSPAASTQRQKAAVTAWPGATGTEVRPAPGDDGIAWVYYKVTNPSAGVWHYEYAVYNQNLDRAIRSFSIPLGDGVTLSNVGFHAPPQHPGWAADGTFANAGFSSVPWTQSQAGGAMSWNAETFAENQNSNAIRWGTMYNFRFDSNRPPVAMNATLGYLKTGDPTTVSVMGPEPASVIANATIAGRITSQNGAGIANVRVTIADDEDNTYVVYTGSLGYYILENQPTGREYTVGVRAKRFSFSPQSQTFTLNNNLMNVDFISVQ